jgi:hypothetical protein
LDAAVGCCYSFGDENTNTNAMTGTRDLVLYLDFDGVLHHHNAKDAPGSGPFLAAPPRYTLFQHAPLLEQLLEPYPHVQIVLSTTWAYRYGTGIAASRLPPRLRERVVGSTFSACIRHLDDFACMARGLQVAGDAANRKPGDWLALDDDTEGWPKEHLHRLVKTHPYEGISPPRVQRKLAKKLAELCA